MMAVYEPFNGPAANPAARPDPVRGECSMNPSSRIPVSKAGIQQSERIVSCRRAREP